MEHAVRFEHVYKRYRLGATRTSLLALLAESLRKAAQRSAPESSDTRRTLWALRDVSFDLPQGHALGVIGPNGAGKTTILKLLAGITRPTSGTVISDGRLSALIELGAGFHPDLTGRENIYLNGAILGLRRREVSRRFDEIVAFSELERFIDTPVKRYSSGMYVRLGFAVASCIEPDILLVDEVLAVGDTAFRQKCMKRIQLLLENGTSIIFVSHNLYMVQAVCPSTLYIQEGEVRYQGKTADAIDAYERDLHEQRAMESGVYHAHQSDEVVDVQIERVEVVGANGRRTDEWRSDDRMEIQVHYWASRPMEAANAVVRIVRSSGLVCCMMRTSLDGVELKFKEGSGAFSVFLEPIQLTGGVYFADARITNAMDSVVLATQLSDWFYVSGAALSHTDQSGVYEPKRRWETVSSSPPDGLSGVL